MPKRKSTRSPVPPQPPVVHEVVDPRWLLKAFAITLVVAFLCSYATLCWLFYQGQWQFALHPSRAVEKNLPSMLSPVSFGVDATGTPQLKGWLMPSSSVNSPNGMYVLFLHGGDGNVDDTLPTAGVLHQAGLNVFLFDYRGFGASGGEHPDEASMRADADSALAFLTGTLHLKPSQIVPFGQGIGASLATRLAADHHDLPALILDSPIGDIDASVAHDPRSRFVPTRLFLHEHFALAAPLTTLTTPKLIISYGGAAPLAARTAADPKVTVELPTHDDVAYAQTLKRFLDLYAPSAGISGLTAAQ